jgi:hypothetical protein
MAAKTGHDMHLYRNTGTVSTPIWTEVAEIGDVSIPDFEMGIAELKRRANLWTKGVASLMQLVHVEFRLISGLGATVYTAIKTKFLGGLPEEYFVADGLAATAGTQGLRLPALVNSFPWDQPLEDVAGHDVRLALAYMESSGTEVDPSWLVVP